MIAGSGNNNSRTLSGLNSDNNLDLPATEDAVRIGGNKGSAGQTIQKDSDNKLKWGFIDDIEIPDNSIENVKLKDKTIENNKIKDGTIVGSLIAPDITFSTTSNLSANQFIATGNFAQTGTATNSFNGPLQTSKITTINNQTEAINVANGGIVNIYKYLAEGGPVTISLAGQTGLITCEDITINNHTGIITFNAIRSNEFATPSTGVKATYLDSDGLHIVGQKLYGIDGNGASANLSNIHLHGTHASLSALIQGDVQILSSTGDTPQDGDLTLTTGDLLITAGNLNMTNGNATLTTGNLTLTAGSLVVSKATSVNSIAGQTTISGNFISTGGADFVGNNSIDMIDGSSGLFVRFNPTIKTITNAGAYVSNKVGNATPPTPTNAGTYTDWALKLADAKGDAFVGRNIVCGGTIYGNVEGTITEEEVDCQRITCRTATPPLAGITGMILGSGAIISNDTTGINELTIDADTSGILANNVSILNNTLSEQALNVVGNVTLSSGSNRTTTIGSVGPAGQTLEVLCQNVNLGETAGAQNQNTLNYRGGIHTFTGATINLSTRLGYTGEGCNLHGSAGSTGNRYNNNIRYFNLDGQQLSHTLAGTIQNFVVLRSNTERSITIAKQVGFSNSSTVFTLPDTYFFENITAPTSVAKLDFDLFYRHKSGVPDLYVRVDSTKAGASPYNASFMKPRILVNTAFGGAGNEIRVTHSYFITGLTPATDYSFYPKFADTTSGSAVGNLKYGDAFGEMSLKLTWLEDYNGVTGDPYAPSDDY